ncbi:F0F1 ATP synthase subunit gamma [Candidatus Uabimicrobium amorphum]|uniref:ATP synthase subunit gamma n=1 Tax=Uabimicrobium amorphum TaxID=2596890 RepID=A0A5S9F5P8_UABAM|nr:F0F1 ATP synthase subunit gamma [Candidatus Uabimicrobium amorphum]BBM85839.1 ATP synthase subunit gamma [Candidatus Uabimicrobium amorphum]
MENMSSLQKRIKTVQELHSIVKTMKALAAVNMHQYEEVIFAINDYNHTLALGMQALLKNTQMFFETPSVKSNKVAAVVFGSDQGMCGQFNDIIVNYTIANLQEQEKIFLVVGSRAAANLTDRKCPPSHIIPLPSVISGITLTVQDILITIEQWFLNREISKVLLFYNSPIPGTNRYTTKHLQVLPFPNDRFHGLQQKKWNSRTWPTFSLPANELFSALIRQYMFATIYRALVESLISENASRLIAMQRAEKNIDEYLHQLNSKYHQQRQTMINEELLDLVAGYTASINKPL